MKTTIQKPIGSIEIEASELDKNNAIIIKIRFNNAEFDCKIQCSDTLLINKPSMALAWQGKPLTGLKVDASIIQQIKETEAELIKPLLETIPETIVIGELVLNGSLEIDSYKRFGYVTPSIYKKIENMLKGKKKEDLAGAFVNAEELEEGAKFFADQDWKVKRYSVKTADLMSYIEASEQKLVDRAEKAAAEKEEREGAIAFHVCWECGVARIKGIIKDGKVAKIDYNEYKKVKADFDSAWKAQFEGNKELLSGAGSGWQAVFESMGYKIAIVDTSYCGC